MTKRRSELRRNGFGVTVVSFCGFGGWSRFVINFNSDDQHAVGTRGVIVHTAQTALSISIRVRRLENDNRKLITSPRLLHHDNNFWPRNLENGNSDSLWGELCYKASVNRRHITPKPREMIESRKKAKMQAKTIRRKLDSHLDSPCVFDCSFWDWDLLGLVCRVTFHDYYHVQHPGCKPGKSKHETARKSANPERQSQYQDSHDLSHLKDSLALSIGNQ